MRGIDVDNFPILCVIVKLECPGMNEASIAPGGRTNSVAKFDFEANVLLFLEAEFALKMDFNWFRVFNFEVKEV